MNIYVHDPQAKLDYTVDWSDWLPDGDTIASSTWLKSSDVLVLSAESATDATATVWVEMSNGVRGQRYSITNRIVTADGRQDDRTMILLCEPR